MVDLFGGSKQKEIQESIEQQIKILATNVEVLNQKLIQDPNAAITPGEAILKKQSTEALQYLKRIESLLSSSTQDITQAVTDQVKRLEATFTRMVKEMERFPEEKAALAEDIQSLGRIIDQLDKLDKSWLNDFLSKVDDFNRNVVNLNNNLVGYHSKMMEAIDKSISQAGQSIAVQASKHLVWVIIASAAVSALVTYLTSIIFFK